MAEIDLGALHTSAKSGLAEAWEELRRAYPDEHVYGFGFYSHNAGYITTTAFTAEGLAEVVEQYRTNERYGARDFGDETAEEHWRRVLRWSPADSPRHLIGEEHLDEASSIALAVREAVDAMIGDATDEDLDAVDLARVTQVYDVLVAVLRELDAEGLFGPDRQLVLNIWEGDQAPEDRIEYARRCNRPELAERFRVEEEASYR